MNNLFSKTLYELNKKHLAAYIFAYEGENLYEFTEKKDNIIYKLTNFSGENSLLVVGIKNSYLLVDSRFTIQAKNENKNKLVKIVEINSEFTLENFFYKYFKNVKNIGINTKRVSIFRYNKIKNILSKLNIKIHNDYKLLDIYNNTKNNISDDFILIDNGGIKNKINKIFSNINNNDKNKYYLTSSLEEIAYITGLRIKPKNNNILAKAFLLLNDKKSFLYSNCNSSDKIKNYLKQSKIQIKRYESIYNDLKIISKNNFIFLDEKLNNYYMYSIMNYKNVKIIKSPLLFDKSIKSKKEIVNLRKCNILDGVAMVKTIYYIKNFYKSQKNSVRKNFLNEYEVKEIVDNNRKEVGGKYFLCPSFDTIVAYKENSAICHYSPTINNCKVIKNDSILLIDSGGHYLLGSTDITRTISLYDKIPNIIKKHYSLVLNSLIRLSIQIFPSGISGSEIDMIARATLYNNFLNFNHGTGHGIGYITNIHDGPNSISPGINKNYINNILQLNQLQSNEPGLYFENKYGIRLENDILTILKKNNEFGDFYGFETMTLCPFDRELIDINYLNKDCIKFLNEYNYIVYEKLSNLLTEKEKKWLKEQTKILNL